MRCFIGPFFCILTMMYDKRKHHWTLPRVETDKEIWKSTNGYYQKHQCPIQKFLDTLDHKLTFSGIATPRKFLTFWHLLATLLILPLYASILYIFDPPKVLQDKLLEEFLRGKLHCQNFTNQDLTFLQLSVIHAT